jgi:hypothetical protein
LTRRAVPFTIRHIELSFAILPLTSSMRLVNGPGLLENGDLGAPLLLGHCHCPCSFALLDSETERRYLCRALAVVRPSLGRWNKKERRCPSGALCLSGGLLRSDDGFILRGLRARRKPSAQ